MDTNVMYIEHYIDLHKYISDNYIELDDKVYTEGINIGLAIGAGIIGLGTIVSLLSVSSYFGISEQLKKLEKFKNNFKEISLTKEEINSIINSKKYKYLELKEKDINKIIQELNDINKEDSLFSNIIKKPLETQSSIETISGLMAFCLFFTTSFAKGIVPKGFKDKLFLSILKLGKRVDKIALDDKYSIISIIEFIKSHFDIIGALSNLLEKVIPEEFLPLVKMAIKFLSSTEYIRHKIKNIDEVSSAINRYAQEKGLSNELNEYLGGNDYKGLNLGEAIKKALENMEILLRFFYDYRSFLDITVEIIKINNKK